MQTMHANIFVTNGISSRSNLDGKTNVLLHIGYSVDFVLLK